jgi:hypothetical protein
MISVQGMKMWAGLASILLCLLIHPSQELPQGSQISFFWSLLKASKPIYTDPDLFGLLQSKPDQEMIKG